MFLFKFLGFLLIAFATFDFAGMYIGYDLTGVSWSPLVAGGLGSLLMRFGGEDD
jgi:hypothetical protein